MRLASLLPVSVALLAGSLLATGALANTPQQGKAVAEGRRVVLEFEMDLGDGQVVESNGNAPLIYTHGVAGNLLPAVQERLIGLHPGEEKRFEISPEDGFGPIDPALLRHEADLEVVPEHQRQVGTLILYEGEDQQYFAEIVEIKGDKVILDLNHPYAGKTLYFYVKVLGVQ